MTTADRFAPSADALFALGLGVTGFATLTTACLREVAPFDRSGLPFLLVFATLAFSEIIRRGIRGLERRPGANGRLGGRAADRSDPGLITVLCALAATEGLALLAASLCASIERLESSLRPVPSPALGLAFVACAVAIAAFSNRDRFGLRARR